MIETPATILRTPRRTLAIGPEPLVMGILNVTPDSFSDGGLHFDQQRALDRGADMIAQGAAIIDVGGESSRPGAQPVSAEEEIRRVIPVLAELQRRFPAVLLSVDTSKPAVAEAALALGAEIVNDIAGLRDPAMVDLVRRAGAAVAAMHMRGTPEVMQQLPPSADILTEVESFFATIMDLPLEPETILLDPGIGFGKTVRDNLLILRCLDRFTRFGRPLLIGASRKSFIGALTGTPAAVRLGGSVAAAVWAWQQGAAILRVHDVAETVQALRVARAIAAGD